MDKMARSKDFKKQLKSSKGKNRNMSFQVQISDFVGGLLDDIGYKKSGSPIVIFFCCISKCSNDWQYQNTKKKKMGNGNDDETEKKKTVRHELCPECRMKVLLNQLKYSVSTNHLFPCLHVNTTDTDLVTMACQKDVETRVLDDLINRASAYFDMSCHVSQHGEDDIFRKVSWKPLKKTTWDRNNQPTEFFVKYTYFVLYCNKRKDG
ncbi:hypothetical protein RFI_08188 [Reticulomyxa filosa]|uniref:Uncharacterized protein n=1 Tax=Reticulomyxa filosa TaxID=46433 RepID=X6NT77_RETFI|nr:hypothetical protein RFI_08188 [Reticulomyxa filosa]|eukprot:ETO28939.1 hypothetical protein RFI_08188 [Reticulomyxa filosa]